MKIAGSLFEKDLPDGRVIFAVPLTFNRARLQIGSPDAMGPDDGW